MRTLVTALRWELFKLTRQRASYVGFLLCLAFAVVMLIGFSSSHFRFLRGLERLGIDVRSLINGPFFASFSLQIGFFAVLPLLAATLGGNQIAGEAKDGTLRALLVRPPSRTTVFVAKTIATWIWLQLNVLFLIALSLLIGTVAFGGGKLAVFVWEFRDSGVWIVASPDWILSFLVVGLGAGASLMMVAALAMMLSTFTDSPVVAHVGTLGAFFISSVLQRLPEQLIGETVRDALPTRHMNYWHELFRLWQPGGGLDAGRFWSDLAWCTGFTGAFWALGLWWLSRKDVTS